MRDLKKDSIYFPPITEGGRFKSSFKNIENETGGSKSSSKHGFLHDVVNCLRSGLRKIKSVLGFVGGTL